MFLFDDAKFSTLVIKGHPLTAAPSLPNRRLIGAHFRSNSRFIGLEQRSEAAVHRSLQLSPAFSRVLLHSEESAKFFPAVRRFPCVSAGFAFRS